MKAIFLLLAIVAVAGCIGQTFTGSVTAASSQQGIEVGNTALDFSFAEIDGSVVSASELRGKPLFIFFTTTWCVPCQAGASQLDIYDIETGDSEFNVLILFVDTNERPEDLRRWESRFGNSDWLLAFDDGSISADYEVRYLDTKYVIDSEGVIRWKDVKPLTYDISKKILAPLL